MTLDRQNGGLLLGFAALAALVVAFPPKPTGHTGAASSDKQGEPPKTSLLDTGPSVGPVPEGPTKPIWDFLNLTPPRADGSSTRYEVELSRNGKLLIEEPAGRDSGRKFDAWPSCCDLHGFTFRFLIATVPDPVDSGLAYSFDQVLEAIQRALEADDYVVDRVWLPWKRSGTKGSVDQRLHERYPGLVLFRDDRDPTPESLQSGRPERRLLALLLVGETPTAGINKLAFRNAVRLIHSCPGCKPERNRVRVLGPMYSGSAFSLGLALHEARERIDAMPAEERPDEPWIKVVCGSASGFAHAPFVQMFAESEGQHPSNAEKRAFATTVLPNDVLLHWVRKYLGNPTDPLHGESPTPIVVLHEANTSFGQFSIGKRSKKAANLERTELFLVPFPLHISQLRASYTKEEVARAESQGTPRSGRNLPFPTENPDDRESSREVLAVRDPLMTAAIDDLILNNLILTMAQKRANYACLVSTDVRDSIFLARKIRDRRPDVKLVALGGDLLYTHEDYYHALRGMIVASTYPLYPSVQGWSDIAEDRRQAPRILFAQESYQGCYNAVLVHLIGQQGTEQRGTEDAKKLTSVMMDYGWEGAACDSTLPPLWFSVVSGNGQMVPVGYISPKDYAHTRSADADTVSADADPVPYLYRRQRASSVSTKVHYGRLITPNAWFLFFTIFFIGNAWCFGRAWRYLRDSRWGTAANERCARYKQRADFAVGCLAQVLLYGRFTELAWTPLRTDFSHHNGHDWRTWLGFLLMLFVWAASLAMMLIPWFFLVCAHRQEFRGWEGKRRWTAYKKMFIWSRPMHGWPFWLRGFSRSGFWSFLPSKCRRRIRGLCWFSRGGFWNFLPLKCRRWIRTGLCWFSRGGFWIFFADVFMLALVSLTVAYFVWRNLVVALAEPQPGEILRFERLVNLFNGVSPMLPWVLFCVALIAWSFFLVKKMYLANHYSIACPAPDNGAARFRGLRDLDKDVRAELMPPSTIQRHSRWCLLIFCLLLCTFLKQADNATTPLDGTGFKYAALLGFFVGSFLLLFTLLQFHFAWRRLRKLLRFLALLPMQNAFERLDDKVVATFGHFLFSLRHSHLSITVQQFYRVRRLFPAFRAKLQHAAKYGLGHGAFDAATMQVTWATLKSAFANLKFGPPVAKRFDKELNPSAEKELQPPINAPALEWGGLTGSQSHELAGRCLRVLYPLWSAHTMEEAFGTTQHAGESEKATAKPAVFLSLPQGDPIREWTLAAEDFVAGEIIRYLSQFIIQLRTLLTCLTFGSFLLLVAATVYPFSPQHQLLLFLMALAGGIALFNVAFLVQLNRDEFVSRITRSTPNRFTPDLSFLHGATIYVLPIVAGLMVQFPLVTSTLRSLFDPLLHIIK